MTASAFTAHYGPGALILGGSEGVGAAGAPLTTVYAAVKAYFNLLAEGLWGELRPKGVDVLGLVLGLTRTPAMQRMGLPLDSAADPAAVAEEALEHLRDGPLWFASGVKPMFDALHGMDRREAVRILGEAAAALH